jgi:hypothetical protein
MKAEQPVEDFILRRLRSLGLSGLGASFLEALAPLAPVGAQLAYMLDPMFARQPGSLLAQLGRLLEQPEDVDALIRRLREEPE